MRDERGLYERISLEAFQSGLAWITILRKRDNFRAAFAGFDPEAVAAFGDDDVARLMADAGIVRNRLKVEATIANARALLDAARRGDVAGRARLGAPRRTAAARRRPAGATSRRSRRSPRRWPRRSSAHGLPLRRADHGVRGDAGLRAGQRPPRRLRRAGGDRGRAATVGVKQA